MMGARSFAVDAMMLLLVTIIVWIMLLFIEYLHAEPLPYPKQPGQQCAGSYVQSGGFCVPMSGGTVRPAVPKPSGAQCPSGWVQSGGACQKTR